MKSKIFKHLQEEQIIKWQQKWKKGNNDDDDYDEINNSLTPILVGNNEAVWNPSA